MKTIETTLTTTVHHSDDGTKRYLLEKVWDNSKPRLAIIMLAPGAAEGIALDNTTCLVLNNAERLGYGSVLILNLFSVVNDFALKQTEENDPENLAAIVLAAKEANAVVYAPGTGKNANKRFQERQKQVIQALAPHRDKLYCLTNSSGHARLQHPLSPAVRTWTLSPLDPAELLGQDATPTEEPPKKGRKKKTEKSS